MSDEKADVIRGSLSAFSAEGVVKAAEEFWGPEIVWHTDPFVPEPGIYSGLDSARSYLEGWVRAFGAFRVEVHDVIAIGASS